jgi:hypothetical protein
MLVIRQLLGFAVLTAIVLGVLVALHAIPELIYIAIMGGN